MARMKAQRNWALSTDVVRATSSRFNGVGRSRNPAAVTNCRRLGHSAGGVPSAIALMALVSKTTSRRCRPRSAIAAFLALPSHLVELGDGRVIKSVRLALQLAPGHSHVDGLVQAAHF